MQDRHKRLVVRFVGLLAFVTALHAIRPVWQPGVYKWFFLRSYVGSWRDLPGLFDADGTYFAILAVVAQLTPVAKVIVAYGLLRVRSWGRNAAIPVLTTDFVFRASGAITMFLLPVFAPHMQKPVMSEGASVQIIPMWPSYLIAIISISSVLVLLQESVKTQFVKARSIA